MANDELTKIIVVVAFVVSVVALVVNLMILVAR